MFVWICDCTYRSDAAVPQEPRTSGGQEIRTRIPRVKVKNGIDEGSQYDTVSDYQSVYTDASGSMCSSGLALDIGKGIKKKNKKKRSQKKSQICWPEIRMLLAGVLTISLVIDLESKYSKICTMKILSLFLGG